MIETLKGLTKHSLVYGLGSLLNKVLGLILLPIYTRYLTPTDYGIFSLLVVTGSIVAIISKLGIGSALFREVIYNESDQSIVESTALYFLLGESALFFGILIALSSYLSELIFSGPGQAFLLRLVFLTGFLMVFRVLVMAKLRITKRSGLYAILSSTNFLIGGALNIYFIVILHLGVEGLIIALLLQEALFTLISLFFLIRDLKPIFSISILRRMLGFGIPLVPAGLSSLMLTSADRYFIQHFSTTAEVGLYSVGYRIGMLLNLIVQSIQLAWPAYMFSIAKKPDAEQQFSRILTYYTLVLGGIWLTLSVLAREVLVIITTPMFYSAYTVVPLVAISYIFYGMRFITNTGLTTQNKMKYMPPIIIGATILNLGLNYLFVPRYGMMGAALATVISYLFLLVIQVRVNLHFLHISYQYKRITKIAIALGLIYGSSLMIHSPNAILNVLLKLVLLLSYPLLLYVFRFYEKEEIDELKRFLQKTVDRFSIGRKYGGN